MDFRRTARIEDWYFGAGDDTLGRVIWFEAPPNAKFFEGPTPFRSLDWWDQLGRIPRGPGPIARVLGTYTLGETIAGYRGDKPCGTMDWFEHGIPSPPPPNPPRNPDGVPACCLNSSWGVGAARSIATVYMPQVLSAVLRCNSFTNVGGFGHDIKCIWNCGVTLAGSTLVANISISRTSPVAPTDITPAGSGWLLVGSHIHDTIASYVFVWTNAPPRSGFEHFAAGDNTLNFALDMIELRNLTPDPPIVAVTWGESDLVYSALPAPTPHPGMFGIVHVDSGVGVDDVFHAPPPWNIFTGAELPYEWGVYRTLDEIALYDFAKPLIAVAKWTAFFLAFRRQMLATLGAGFASSVATVAGISGANAAAVGSAASVATVTGVGSSAGRIVISDPSVTLWTCVCGPSGIVDIDIYGAGAGGTHNAVAAGGGGGGGAYTRLGAHSVTLGANYLIQIGTGGSQNTDGTATWFDSTTTGYADFGLKGTGAAGGAKGLASNCVPVPAAHDGGAGGTASLTQGGGGGSSGTILHNGTNGVTLTGGIAPDADGGNGGNGGVINAVGSDGTAPGGGGGGSGRLGATAGAGKNGQLVISWSS